MLQKALFVPGMCSVSHALGACQSLYFTQTQAQPHECAGELLSRLQDCASTACPGWLCHAITVECGEAGREGKLWDVAKH